VELATFIVAVLAVGISLAALVFTWRQDIRAKKQDKRLVDIEERDQKRFEQEMTADPHAELVDFSKMAKTNFRSYAFVITNTGKESASDLDLQLMDDSGNAVSQPERIGVLAQGGSEKVLVNVVDEARDRNPLHLKLTWLDRRGENERTSRVEVPSDWNRP
jgi:hypothetical protein